MWHSWTRIQILASYDGDAGLVHRSRTFPNWGLAIFQLLQDGRSRQSIERELDLSKEKGLFRPRLENTVNMARLAVIGFHIQSWASEQIINLFGFHASALTSHHSPFLSVASTTMDSNRTDGLRLGGWCRRRCSAANMTSRLILGSQQFRYHGVDSGRCGLDLDLVKIPGLLLKRIIHTLRRLDGFRCWSILTL